MTPMIHFYRLIVFSLFFFFFFFSLFFFVPVVVRRVPVGIGDDGPATVRRGWPVRNDGVPSRRLPTGPAEALPRRILRRDGRLLVRSVQGPADHASTPRLSSRLSRRPRRFRLKKYNSTRVVPNQPQFLRNTHTHTRIYTRTVAFFFWKKREIRWYKSLKVHG